MPNLLGLPRYSVSRFRRLFVFCLLLVASTMLPAQRITLQERSFPEFASGARVPDSQEISLILRLAISPERVAALRQRLRDQLDPRSIEYHRWLSPVEFGRTFGQTDVELAATTLWLQSKGLTVAASEGRTTLTASGNAAEIEAIFGVVLRQAQRGGRTFYANDSVPSIPNEAASLIAAVHGLDDLPSTIVAGDGNEPIAELASALDANVVGVLRVTETACNGELTEVERESYEALFRRANAQGVTMLANSMCSDSSGGFPLCLSEVTGLVVAGNTVIDAASGEPRPAWQVATGLPQDALRHTPDLTTAGVPEFAEAIEAIAQKAGRRLGNINETLYELAPIEGLYTQRDDAPVGTWERETGLGLVDLDRLVKVFPRGVGANFVSLNSTSYSPVHGQSITLTSNVSSGTGGATPTGTVSFVTSAGTTLGIAALAGGTATFSTNALPGGMTTLVAKYSGDATYAAAASPSASIFVQAEASALSAAVSTGAVIGGSYTVAVTDSASSGVGVPTGTITVTLSGTTTSYTGTLVSSGASSSMTTVTIPATQVGTATLSINCSGDATYRCSNPLTKTVTTAKATPTLVLAYTPNPPVSGASISFTASLAAVGSAPVPTGNVSFFDGTTTINAGKLSGGMATATGTDITTDTHSISATYDGDANYLSVTVTGATSTAVSTTTTLTSTSTIANGTSITFTATISPVGVAAPTGMVSFYDGSSLLGSSPVTADSASFATASLDVASTHQITAAYSGDSAHKASTSAVLVVRGGSATGAVTGSLAATLMPASALYNGVVAVSAIVTLPAGTTLPAGSMVDAQITGLSGTYSGTLVAGSGESAAATISVPAPVPGSYMVSVACTATAAFACSQQVTLELTTTKGATVTALVVSPVTVVAGASVMLTATVVPMPPATMLTVPASGVATFYENGNSIGTGPLDTTGVATLTAVAGAGTTHLYTAVYGGDTNYLTSTSTAGGLLTPSILLTSSAASSLSGLNVVLTANVVGVADGMGVIASPSGGVSFYDTESGAPVLLGMAVLSGNDSGTSVAMLSTTGLMDGMHSIYVLYAGDGTYSTAMSKAITVAVLDYNVAFTPQTLTLQRGATGNVVLPVTLVGAFQGTITFACTPPAGTQTTCTFNPTVVNGAGETTLTVTTTGSTTASAEIGKTRGFALATAFGFFFLLGLRKRRGRLGLILVLMIALIPGPSIGCGTGTTASTQPMTNSGTPLGTTFFTITAAGFDGTHTIRHMYQFQVTVTE